MKNNVTWKEISMFTAFGIILAGIVFTYAQNAQKLDNISARQDRMATKIGTLADTQIDMAKELVRIGTIISINQHDGKLSDSQSYVIAYATPTPLIAYQPNYSNGNSAQFVTPPSSQPAQPTPVPHPTPSQNIVPSVLDQLLSPVPNLLR